MKLISILLIISSLTKLYLANDVNSVSVDSLLKGIHIDELKAKQILSEILVLDGLIGLLSGIFILCAL